MRKSGKLSGGKLQHSLTHVRTCQKAIYLINQPNNIAAFSS